MTQQRNGGHRERQARLLAAAADDAERLSAAFDWFRSSVRLMERRGARAEREARAVIAERIMREMTVHLKQAAEAIDRGDYDPGKR
jgi:hypothetical protein